ncbi:MAG: hypothetical protein K0Q51_897 [Rickettsiaceae bacterium]|jgi:hypothetical protein|nr:hypothetical protein [Rickettsiaceae bacterium]
MTTAIKFQAPFERIKQYNETTPDLGLRKAIILQAITDASTKSTSKILQRIADEAREWLFGNSKNFQIICYEAGLEPDYVAKIAKQILDLHDSKELDERTLKEINERMNLLI